MEESSEHGGGRRRRRGGRPSLPKEEKRGIYPVRLSAVERAQAEVVAREHGIKLSEYCRRAVLGRSQPRPVPKLNRLVWMRLSKTACALEKLAEGKGANGEIVAQLQDLEELLKSTRLALLGIHHVPGDPV